MNLSIIQKFGEISNLRVGNLGNNRGTYIGVHGFSDFRPLIFQKLPLCDIFMTRRKYLNTGLGVNGFVLDLFDQVSGLFVFDGVHTVGHFGEHMEA